MKLMRVEKDGKPVGWAHYCPACKSTHLLYVEQPSPTKGAKWKFDGNQARPTFTPSVRCFTTDGHWDNKAPHKWLEGKKQTTTCHYNITNGMLVYHGDSPHSLAGKSVPLPDYPEGES